MSGGHPNRRLPRDLPVNLLHPNAVVTLRGGRLVIHKCKADLPIKILASMYERIVLNDVGSPNSTATNGIHARR